MWLSFAFLSALLLGFYDVFKKLSLKDNAVIPVLFINTLLCALFFLPVCFRTGGELPLAFHGCVAMKSAIVLSSWICGYFAIKHLPLTIVGPVNATRPVMVLLGALLVFGERLNLWQWGGVVLAILSFFLLSLSGRREGIRFSHNRWVGLLVLAAVLGAVSGLYDKFLMAAPSAGGLGLDRLAVQGWYNVYQALMMAVVFSLMWMPRRASTPFRWRWSIVFISLFLTAADMSYFYALSLPGAMISVVSLVRRSSVLVSFLFGALVLHEKNLRAKAFDLLLVLLGMVLLYVGTR